MTDIYDALIAAIGALDAESRGNLCIALAKSLSHDSGAGIVALRTRVALGVGTALNSPMSPIVPVIGAPQPYKTPFFIREVLEYDPSVFNGWSITKGAFIPNFPKYTGGELIMLATRGRGEKLIAFGKREVGSKYVFTYASGATGVVEGFGLIAECKSWPEAHTFLAARGVPHGKAVALKRSTGT